MIHLKRWIDTYFNNYGDRTDLSDLGGQLEILFLFLKKSRDCVDVVVSLGHLAQSVAARHEVFQSRAGQFGR